MRGRMDAAPLHFKNVACSGPLRMAETRGRRERHGKAVGYLRPNVRLVLNLRQNKAQLIRKAGPLDSAYSIALNGFFQFRGALSISDTIILSFPGDRTTKP